MIKIKFGKNNIKRLSRDMNRIISLEKSKQSQRQETKRKLVTHLQDRRENNG